MFLGGIIIIDRKGIADAEGAEQPVIGALFREGWRGCYPLQRHQVE